MLNATRKGLRDSENGRRGSARATLQADARALLLAAALLSLVGACYDLSKYLLSLQDVTTVAFVHSKVTRHTVLPVLSCKEIIMSKEARLGDVADEPVEPLGFVEEGAYKEVAKRRSLSEALVLKMLKKNMVVFEGETLK